MGWNGPVHGLTPTAETTPDRAGIFVDDDAEPADANTGHDASEADIQEWETTQ